MNRIKPYEKVIELPLGFLGETKISLDAIQLSVTQYRPEQVVDAVFENISVNKDGTIKYGFKLLDVKMECEDNGKRWERLYNDYIVLSPLELEKKRIYTEWDNT